MVWKIVKRSRMMDRRRMTWALRLMTSRMWRSKICRLESRTMLRTMQPKLLTRSSMRLSKRKLRMSLLGRTMTMMTKILMKKWKLICQKLDRLQ
jgi:hypothetical protein